MTNRAASQALKSLLSIICLAGASQVHAAAFGYSLAFINLTIQSSGSDITTSTQTFQTNHESANGLTSVQTFFTTDSSNYSVKTESASVAVSAPSGSTVVHSASNRLVFQSLNHGVQSETLRFSIFSIATSQAQSDGSRDFSEGWASAQFKILNAAPFQTTTVNSVSGEGSYSTADNWLSGYSNHYFTGVSVGPSFQAAYTAWQSDFQIEIPANGSATYSLSARNFQAASSNVPGPEALLPFGLGFSVLISRRRRVNK